MSSPSSWKTRRDALPGADVTALKAALSDSNRFVRAQAVKLLEAHLEEPKILEMLVARLSDRSIHVRRAVLEFVPHFGATALPALEAMLTTETMQSVCLAAPAIAKMAEARPHIGQRNLANILNRRAKSWWLVFPADRKILRECAERIEQAIEHLKDMPIAAGAPTTQADLPRPASEPGVDPMSLPIPWWQAIFRRDR